MNRALLTVASALLAASSIPAQCTLTVLGTGQPGTVLRFEVQSNPGDYTAVTVSDQTGSFSVPVPGGSLALNVLQPWTVIETGFADMAGFAVLNMSLPASSIVPLSLHGQGIALLAPFNTVQLCATNTVPFSIG